MSQEREATTYEAQARVIAELVADYESAHPPGTPCFSEALALMTTELTP